MGFMTNGSVGSTLTDGGNPTVGQSGAMEMLWNGNGWDRRLSNIESQLLPSATRTASITSSDIGNFNGRSLIIYVNVTAFTTAGAPALRVSIEGKDQGGNYYPLAGYMSSNIIATGKYIFSIGLGIGAGIGGQAATGATNIGQIPWPVPRTWRLNMIANDASSFTYQVWYALLV